MPQHPERDTATLGDLVHVVYESMLARYRDPELASVATATVINEVLADRARPARREQAA